MKEYAWYKNYPEGVPREINPDSYRNLGELFSEAFDKFKHQDAFVNMGKSLTYGELERHSVAVASYFVNVVKLKKGDRIAIQMPNLLQYPVVLVGALRAGLIVVNTNPLYTSSEMKHQFVDSGVRAIVILENFACNLENILSATAIEKVIITKIGDMLGGLKGGITNFVVKSIKKMVPPYRIEGAIPFKSVLKQGAAHSFTDMDLEPNDIAFLQYTGGTTGVSKGAMLSHRNIIANIEQTIGSQKPLLVEGQEIIITALPLYHVFALTVNFLTMAKMGAKSILITNPRDMKSFMKDLSKHKFTIITGVNTLFNGMMNQSEFKTLDFSKLKISMGGGMAVQKFVALKWKEMTGCTLDEGYGLTETSPLLCVNPCDTTGRLGTIGLPVMNTEIKLVDDEGNEVPLGEPGELCAKGPQVTSGYWNRPEETKNAFDKDGWFKTGDMATQDEDGFFKIVDRKKEMILVSGFNVYPNEVEDVLVSHPLVDEAGVIAVPDARSNEAVKAFVVPVNDTLTEEELHAYCKKNLTGYKRPKYIEFKKELPKSNVGKILRRILKEEDAKVNSYN